MGNPKLKEKLCQLNLRVSHLVWQQIRFWIHNDSLFCIVYRSITFESNTDKLIQWYIVLDNLTCCACAFELKDRCHFAVCHCVLCLECRLRYAMGNVGYTSCIAHWMPRWATMLLWATVCCKHATSSLWWQDWLQNGTEFPTGWWKVRTRSLDCPYCTAFVSL